MTATFMPCQRLKYPSGLDKLMRRLESEGRTVVQRGGRFFVEDCEQELV